MFSAFYIKKCTKGRGEVECLRESSYASDDDSEVPLKFTFEKDDYFYHQATMREDEVNMVAKVEEDYLYAVGEKKAYKIQDCIWIPTAGQLQDLLSYHSIEAASGQDAERILENFMYNQENKRWDKERGDWVEVKS